MTKYAKQRLWLAQVSPPTNEDWMVTVHYRGFDGKDNKETIRVGQHGNPGMSEERAVELALESLKKSQIDGAHGVFASVPKVYNVKAVRRSSLRVQQTVSTFQDWLARQRKA